jgi:predicted ATPase
MRVPAQLIESSARLATWSPRGQGLAAIFDAVFTRDFGRIVQLNAEFAALFPSVKQLTLENTGDQRKRLGVVLQNGTSVSAEQISEGMLYWLAFKALEFLEPAGLILVEEPENGLHPARIREVMKVLRDLSTRSQVILATHSPIVINELEGDEVTVLTRDPVRGTQATRLCDTPNYEERSRVYQNGELWLAYSDGDSEAALLDSKVVD